MSEVADLVVKVRSQGVTKSEKDLKKLGREAKETESKVKKLGSTAKIAIASLGGLAAGTFTVELFKTNLEFDKLNASLQTVTGSAEGADEAFKAIKEFATRTPFDVQQVTAAFIKLSALGLSPSERALTSYGNTASAMGKELDQMIEAVADAATGEFERLKEFGIKAKSQGDQVSFTFGGVTKTIGKNAAEIQDYLLELGESKFGDAMALQVETLGGSISNLGVAWDGFLDAVLDSKTSTAIGGYIDQISGGINALTNGIDEATEVSVKLVKEHEKLDDLLSKQRNAGEGLFDFSSAEDYSTEIAYQRTLIAGLTKDYEGFKKLRVNKDLDDIAAAADNASEKTFKLSGAMSKSLKAATKDATKAKDEFQKLFDDLTAPDAKKNEDVNILDVELLTLQAQSANKSGDYDDAITKAKQAFALLDQMKEAGTLTDGVLEYMAENIKKVGIEAGNADLTALELKIDAEKAKFEMTDAQRVMQEQATASPIIQPVIFEFGKGDIDFSKTSEAASNSTPTAPKSPSSSAPTIISINGKDSPPAFMDAQGSQAWADEIKREQMKRGKR